MPFELHTENELPELDVMAGEWIGGNGTPEYDEPCTPSGVPKMRSVSDVASIREYAAQKIDFIVEGIIAAGTVTAITGESGAGKTTVVTAICSAVDRGVPFAGLETQRRP